MKKSLILGTAIAAALTSGSVLADLTGNAAISSNYIWRGITQTLDQAAGSGGIDWSDNSGLYAGTWVSNVDFSGDFGSGYEDGTGYEMDVYLGFSGEAGNLGYDVGIITYQYPVTPNFNFTEIYASGSFSMFTVGLNLTVDNASGNDGGVFAEDDIYLSFSADVTDTISVYAGSYMFDNDGAAGVGDVDYIHFGASLSKDDFTFAVDKNDLDGTGIDGSTDNVRFTVSWGKEFEL